MWDTGCGGPFDPDVDRLGDREGREASCVPIDNALTCDSQASSRWTPSVHGVPDLDAVRRLARIVFGGAELALVMARIEARLARAGALGVGR